MGVVYGNSSVLDDTRDNLVTLMTNLSTAMSGSTDPYIESVYSQHNEVITSFNAVSIDLEDYSSSPSGLDDGIITDYSMTWSIRIHTNYIGGATNSQKAVRLMDSIKGYLNTHKIFTRNQNFRIDNVSGGLSQQVFEESYTVGGVLLVTVLKRESHVQE